MALLPQILFVGLLATAIYLFYQSCQRIYANIQLGKPFDASDNKGERVKQMILIALGQKKMFKRPIPAILHLMVYLGFLIVNIELLEIVLDGVLGTHRLFAPFFGDLYPYIINFFEFFAVAVLLSCVIFLIRRNALKIERFHKKEMSSWAKLDANIILVAEVFLMLALLSMNATDTLIQQKQGVVQSFFFSDLLIPLYNGMSLEALNIAERAFWWVHIVGIFAFANYVPYSKHLHIFLAFPNTYFTSFDEKGKMQNMESITTEVKIMMGQPVEQMPDPNVPVSFGAKDITDLSQKSLLDAYTCTECGRCTDNCPSNMTGKKLSPRKIMMNVRERTEEVGKGIKLNGADYKDDKKLLDDYITEEELFACTSCNACVEACPVNINPLNIITELRRYKAMEETKGPQEWNMVYSNIETSFAPWKFPPTDRFNWKDDV
ncbi:MAG: (Fe-S)-binding protein [Cytophagales bacterium]|nr:(Fe-S)-binding protein [Cytophagales bacterium]